MDSFAEALYDIFITIVGLFLGITWLAGFAISGSAWSIIPFYAWYAVIEKAMNFYQIFGYTS